MPRTIGETMIAIHSYGPFALPKKDAWVIIGSGPTARRAAFETVPESTGIISVGSVIGGLVRSDVHMMGHYEDYMTCFPHLQKAKTIFMSNPIHVGYRCYPMSAYHILDSEYFSDHSEIDLRFFEKNLSLKNAIDDPRALYVESTIATAALHLLARSGIHEARTLGIDGGIGHSKDFQDVYFYRDSYANSYDKGFAEFQAAAKTLGVETSNYKAEALAYA